MTISGPQLQWNGEVDELLGVALRAYFAAIHSMTEFGELLDRTPESGFDIVVPLDNEDAAGDFAQLATLGRDDESAVFFRYRLLFERFLHGHPPTVPRSPSCPWLRHDRRW